MLSTKKDYRILSTLTKNFLVFDQSEAKQILLDVLDLLPVYQPPGLDVGDGVAGHPVARVLLAADDDPQLVGSVFDESHHL